MTTLSAITNLNNNNNNNSNNKNSVKVKRFTLGDVLLALNMLKGRMDDIDIKAKWTARDWAKIPGKDRIYINKDGVSVGYLNVYTGEFLPVPDGWDKLRYATRNVIKDDLVACLE